MSTLEISISRRSLLLQPAAAALAAPRSGRRHARPENASWCATTRHLHQGVRPVYYGRSRKRPASRSSVPGHRRAVAQIKTMVETKNSPGTWQDQLARDPAADQRRHALSRKARLESEPVIKTIPPDYMSPYGVGTNVYTTVLAYRTTHSRAARRRNPGRFLDVAEFPGRRAVRKHPFDTIEEALMGAGRADRAGYRATSPSRSRRSTRSSPPPPLWWTTGAQVEQMLTSGEIE